MEDNSPKNNDDLPSWGQMFLGLSGVFVFILGIAFYGATLMILAFIVTFGSITVGVLLILHSYTTGDARSLAISREVEHMSNDTSFDISEELITWDKLKYTKGIGTRMEGQDRDIEDIHRRLVIARDELVQATTPVHRIEAVLAADSVLAIARELRKPAQS